MGAALTSASPKPIMKRLNLFERYLTLWVGFCMVAGVAIGTWMPRVAETLRRLEFATDSHINLPIAGLIWLMIIPMMMRVDFASVRNVGRNPTGLAITLFVNWLVKPFSMAFFAWVCVRSFPARPQCCIGALRIRRRRKAPTNSNLLSFGKCEMRLLSRFGDLSQYDQRRRCHETLSHPCRSGHTR